MVQCIHCVLDSLTLTLTIVLNGQCLTSYFPTFGLYLIISLNLWEFIHVKEFVMQNYIKQLDVISGADTWQPQLQYFPFLVE